MSITIDCLMSGALYQAENLAHKVFRDLDMLDKDGNKLTEKEILDVFNNAKEKERILLQKKIYHSTILNTIQDIVTHEHVAYKLKQIDGVYLYYYRIEETSETSIC